MDNRSILIALHQLSGIGWKTIRLLMAGLVDMKQLLFMSAEDISRHGVPAAKARTIADAMTEQWVEQQLERYNRLNIGIITVFDEEYPERLRHIAQPPWVLYTQGRQELMQCPAIAVVGTRMPTAYGRKAAGELAGELSAAGVTVVSGLARGIDGEAHRAALAHAGSTIAVLGCAAGEVYPRENRALLEQIAERGLILSEYPLDTPLHPGMFPLRNRIIAGLSLGTLVVEAADRSGSLITAEQCLEQSGDVYAVPGPITSPKSRGTNSLIQQGAKLVATSEDILVEIQRYIRHAPRSPKGKAGGDKPEALPPDEQAVLDLIGLNPVTFDLLLERSGFSFGHLHSVLLSLLMKKRIEQKPGPAYTVI
ncbi:DNA-processing protein DprA [Paenibacillus sp. y28]|uniref:DNA-processing protein DprA n=1 Tax=Paenibacillus sp. y28 TaxID=3129110 RepID=UPI0030198154